MRSQRGPDGGFWLARPASEISLADIIRAIDGPLVGVRGERPENLGYIGAAEPLQTVWIALRANERAILEDVTLEHIVSGHLPESVRKLADDPARLGLNGQRPDSAGPASEARPCSADQRYTGTMSVMSLIRSNSGCRPCRA